MKEIIMSDRLTDDEIARRLATPLPAPQDGDELMTPAQVSQLMKVDPKTVTRWAKAGKLTCFRTLGGHRRYYAAEVRLLLNATRQERTP